MIAVQVSELRLMNKVSRLERLELAEPLPLREIKLSEGSNVKSLRAFQNDLTSSVTG
jgi:hypothetical protein